MRRHAILTKRFAPALLLTLALASSGCSSWLQSFANDPPAAIATLLQQVQGYISAAIAIFDVIAPLLPADKQAPARADFAKAVATADAAIQALVDAEKAAVAAGNSNPDLGKVVSDVVDAVDQVQKIIDTWKTPAPGAGAAAASVPGLDALAHAQAAIDKYKR